MASLLDTLSRPDWRTVPRDVARYTPDAIKLAGRVRQLELLTPIRRAVWDPVTKTADFGDAELSVSRVALPGIVDRVAPLTFSAVLKRANSSAWAKPFELAGAPFGGPTPLTNSLIGGLVGGGLGYGAGWLAEKFLPEEYFEPGKLRRTLGLAGAGVGAGLPLLHNLARYSGARNTPNAPGFLQSFVTPTAKLPASDQAAALRQIDTTQLGPPSPQLLDDARTKAAAFGAMTGGDDVRPVPVDRFNRAIWEGTSPTLPDPTPPAVAAAAAGLVSGVASQYGAPSLLSPRHFVTGLATAGVDGVTATIAGTVLGALGGMKPQAQRDLQRAGLWTGLVRGITGSVLGLR